MTISSTTRGDHGAITRRAALGAFGAAAAGFAVFGPRGTQDIPRGRTVLDYWEKWTRHEGDAMERIVRAYNTSQSRVWVRYIVVSDIGQKSLVSIAGGNPLRHHRAVQLPRPGVCRVGRDPASG